jgi:arylsulfatase
MPDDLKPVLARQMEVYAGFLEHTDHHVGRLIDAWTTWILDDTLVYYIVGDNGASAEARRTAASTSSSSERSGPLETREFMAARSTSFGTPRAYNHYAVGWATRWTRPTSGRSRSRRTGAARATARSSTGRGHSPRRGSPLAVPPRDRRSPPTVLEPPDCPSPTVNGVEQMPLHGRRACVHFDDAERAERTTTQYFEMFCNRGIYHEGWTAVTRHIDPVGDDDELPPFATTCGSSMPPTTGRRRTTSRRAAREARRAAAALPPGGRASTTCCRSTTRRSNGSTQTSRAVRSLPGLLQLLFGGMGRLTEHSILSLKNKSHAITARSSSQRAALMASSCPRAERSAASSSTQTEGKLAYCYNLFGLRQFKVYGDTAHPGRRAPGADGVHLRRRRDW